MTLRKGINLAKKLKYKKPLTTTEKSVLARRGWIKSTKNGIVLTKTAKKKLRVIESLI